MEDIFPLDWKGGKELFLKLGLLYDCDVRQYENIVYVEKLHLVVLACSSIYICFFFNLPVGQDAKQGRIVLTSHTNGPDQARA